MGYIPKEGKQHNKIVMYTLSPKHLQGPKPSDAKKASRGVFYTTLSIIFVFKCFSVMDIDKELLYNTGRPIGPLDLVCQQIGVSLLRSHIEVLPLHSAGSITKLRVFLADF